jgi:hypothetical protein
VCDSSVSPEAEYLADISQSISGTDSDKLKAGYAVCKFVVNAASAPEVKGMLVKQGLTYANADLLVQSAFGWLCPDA